MVVVMARIGGSPRRGGFMWLRSRLTALLETVFDANNVLGGDVVIITSYETHKMRSIVRNRRTIPSVPYSEPRN